MAAVTQEITTAEALEAYAIHSFDTDVEYQQGLVGILSSGVLDGISTEEKDDMMRRTRVFYFNKIKGCNISESDAKRAEELSPATLSPPSQSPNTGGSATTAQDPVEEPRVLSFAELQELILQGKTDEIPNNKLIPDILSDTPPSQSVATPKKKPWEKD